MRTPSADELKKINACLPESCERLKAEDLYVVDIIIADNIVNRGQSRWSIDSLKKICDMLPGKPALKNHEHDEVEEAWGRFFDAKFCQDNEVDDSILNCADNDEYNQEIFQSEGYCYAKGSAFVAKDHPIVDDIRFARVNGNSLGFFRYKDFICPECGFSLMNQKCPHTLEGMEYDENTPTVPYYIRDGIFDLGESSLVNIPNLPNSRIL